MLECYSNRRQNYTAIRTKKSGWLFASDRMFTQTLHSDGASFYKGGIIYACCDK